MTELLVFLSVFVSGIVVWALLSAALRLYGAVRREGSATRLTGLCVTALSATAWLAATSPPVRAAPPLVVDSINGRPTQGFRAMTLNTAIAPGRQFVTVCTVAGTLTVTFANGTTLALVPVGVGITTYPWAVSKYNTFATGTCSSFGNLD